MMTQSAFHKIGLPDADILEAKSTIMMSITKTIKNRGWTQKEAAEEMGIGRAEVSRMVNGHLSRFSLEALLKIEIRLGKQIKLTQMRGNHENGHLSLAGF